MFNEVLNNLKDADLIEGFLETNLGSLGILTTRFKTPIEEHEFELCVLDSNKKSPAVDD